jgi:hypothetical protein
MSKEAEVKSDEEVVAPTPEDEKSVQDLIDAKDEEVADDAGEADDSSDGTDDGPVDGDGDPPEPEKKQRQVPVSVVQKERQRRREAEARAKALEERSAALESQVAKPQQESLQKPQLSQFNTVEEYADALAEYSDKKAELVARQTVAKEFQTQTEAQRQAEQKREADMAAAKFNKMMDDARAEDEAFEESFQYMDSVSFDHPSYSNAIVESPVADKLIKFLASNTDEAERIATLSPTNQVKAIGAIEDKITAPPPKPNKTTQAPKPVNAVSGNAKTGKVKWKPNMSKSEREAFRKQAEGVSISELL